MTPCVSQYRRLYREAEVLDRWAAIYGGTSLQAEFARLHAANLRLWAEIVKALHLEEIAARVDGLYYRVYARVVTIIAACNIPR